MLYLINQIYANMLKSKLLLNIINAIYMYYKFTVLFFYKIGKFTVTFESNFVQQGVNFFSNFCHKQFLYFNIEVHHIQNVSSTKFLAIL